MARRNNLLVVTLLFMVAVLIGAILLGGERNGPNATPPGAGSGVGGAQNQGAGVRAADTPLGAGESREQSGDRGRAEVATGGADGVGVPKLTLRGRLVGEDGAPAVAVAIHWEADADLTFRMPIPGRREAATVKTDAGGRFAMSVGPEEDGSIRLDRADARVFAANDRRSLELRTTAADQDLGDLTVRDGITLRGVVVDEVGQPLPSARLRVTEGRVSFGFDFGGEPTVVDGEGRFVVHGLEPGSCHLTVAATGFIPEARQIELKREAREEEQRFQLRRGASVAGAVFDDVGRPIAGARVGALRSRRVSSGIDVQQFNSSDMVETGENGGFVLAGIEGDSVTLRISAAGHASESEANVVVGRTDVIVQLQRLGSVSGVLRDPNGAAIANSEVRARTGGGDGLVAIADASMTMPSMTSARTDENGEFRLGGVRPGVVTLSAEGETHLPFDGLTVQVLPGGSVEHVQLVAEVGAVLDVLVIDAAGEPVVGAGVEVTKRVVQTDTVGAGGGRRIRMSAQRDVDTDGSGPPAIRMDEPTTLRTGTTGADGRVLLSGLPAEAVVVRASHAAFAPARPTELQVPMRGKLEVIATLRPAGFVAVRVLDTSGGALDGARFVLTGPQGDDSGDHHGTTGSDGSTRVGPLLAGHYVGRIELPPEPMEFGGMRMLIDDNGAVLEETRRPVEIRAGEDATLVLTRPILTALSGTVFDSTGLVKDAEVRLARATDQPLLGLGGKSVRTDAEGRYTFADLSAGMWRIEWKRPESPVAAVDEFEIAPGLAKMERDLRIAGGSVRVRVVSAIDESPLPRADVSLRRLDDQGRGSERRAVGIFMVSANVDGGDSGTQSVSMRGGPGTVRTDTEGVAILTEVPTGEYVLVVEHNKHSDARTEGIAVTDGSETDAGVITMQPAGIVRGRITGFAADDQARMAMVTVKAVGAADGEERRETAMGGSFKIDRLAPGDYELRASSIGQDETTEGPTQTVTVRAGEVTRTDLPLR